MRVALAIVLLLLTAACASAPEANLAPTAAAAASPTAVSVEAAAVPTEAIQNGPPTSAALLPAWQTLPLVNARTGESFTLSDYAGKTVLVRSMAQWCTNCRNGQRRWRDEVQGQVNADNVVFVTLDLDPSSTSASLAQYADSNGFPWVFAVMTPELQQQLVAQFGNTVLVAPAEPQWMIRPDGTAVGLLTDFSTPSLVNLLNGAAS